MANDTGKIVLMMSVSLDGFIARPGGELDWHRISDEVHRHFNDVLGHMAGFLYGRTMYELMAGFWPAAGADPASSPPVVEFSRIWRETPKTVYSRTLERAGWDTTVLREVVPEEVRALKASAGGDLGIGGAGIAATFLECGLIDEVRLYVHPVAIGQGKPLLDGIALELELLETRTFGNGVVLLHYRVAG